MNAELLRQHIFDIVMTEVDLDILTETSYRVMIQLASAGDEDAQNFLESRYYVKEMN